MAENSQHRSPTAALSLLHFLTLFVGIFCWTSVVFAAEPETGFYSKLDEELTVQKVSVLPVSDNLDGIYARPIEAHLINLVKKNHQWDYVESNLSNPVIPTDLEEKPVDVQRLGRNVEADAFFAASASKGPNGMTLTLDMFLKVDGKLFAQEVLKDHPRFEINDLKEQVQTLFKKVTSKIPYQGLVLSRQQNRVTMNLGKLDGILKDQILTVIQVIKVTRHPKFNFLVSTEKEILGKIKVLKIDDNLSFGSIISEKDKGAVRKLSKIGLLDSVSYPVPDDLGGGGAKGDIAERPDAEVTFGKNPQEWVPLRPPSFGLVGVKLGLGTFNSSANMTCSGSCTALGSLEAKSSFYPSLGLFGELWLNPNFTVRGEVEQGIISTPNPRSGSSPSSLNHAMSRYALTIGYNFLLLDDFFGPKFTIRGGFMTYRLFVDDSSPRALTTTSYSGLLLGLGGSLPIDDRRMWYIGGELNLMFLTRMNEQPETSGEQSNNGVYFFSLFGERKIAENMRLIGSVDFSLYTTNFSGAAGSRGSSEIATSISQRHTRLMGGIQYMF